MRAKSLKKLWPVAFWLIVWECASLIINQRLILVSPVQVAVRLSLLIVTESFWLSCGNTFMKICAGYLLGLALGILLAILSVRSKTLRELLSPLMLTVRTVPVASFIILALILFSSKRLTVFISFLMVLPIIYANVLQGIDSTDTALLEMAQVFDVKGWRRIRYIYVSQAAPYLMSACSVAAGFAWKSGVAAEVIGMPALSIGEKLQQAKVFLDTTDLFAWTVAIVALSLLFERLFRLLLRALFKLAEDMP